MYDNRSTFFIVGAPRCGTTSLSKILARHPEVCFSKPKETWFFVRPVKSLSRDYLERAFVQQFFPHLAGHHRVLGEGSVSLLYSPEGIERVLAFDPDARFIVMVRNPIDQVYSYHARALYMTDETVTDFAQAWDLQAERAQGRRVPSRCRDPRLLLYGEIGSLGKYVEKLFATVGRDRCHVVVFDDFVRDTGTVYADLCAFLGVVDDGRRDFPKKNDNKEFRQGFLQTVLMNPPALLIGALAVAGGGYGAAMRRTRPLRKWIKKRNTYRAHRPPLSETMRAQLRDYFRDDIGKLAGLLGRDLSHWR